MTSCTRVVIDLAALKHNAQVARNAAPHSKLLAVIKADAYGHGLLQAAAALDDANGFAVARLDEAIALREAGVKKRILVLSGFLFENDVAIFSKHDLDTVVHSDYQLELLSSGAVSTPLSIWLKINTGMNRLGVEASDVGRIHDELALSGKVRLPIKLMTHFASADDMGSLQTEQQLTVFDDCVGGLAGEHSIANSAGLLGWQYAQRDWVRPGIMLYGGSPFFDKTADELNLKPVMTLESTVTSLRVVEKGACVGYGATWRAERTSLIATVGIGYGDGYPRHASEGTTVVVAGQKAPLVGRVSMDTITVDVSQCRDVTVGNQVILWGRGLPIDDVADSSETISYELMCGITNRVLRVYNEVGKGE